MVLDGASGMLVFPAIWWLFPAAGCGLILFSWYLTRSGGLGVARIRNGFVAAGALLGLLALALPFFQQPRLVSPFLNYAVGVPLAVAGLVGRIYPMVYLRQKGTTTAMSEVGKLVDSGPYGWVRHPQYTSGFIMLCGWSLAWGAVYSMGLLPLLGAIIYVQALVEERYILSPQFGQRYVEYRERVGMLIPRVGRRRFQGPQATMPDDQ